MIKGIDFQKIIILFWFVRRHVLDEVFPILVMSTITHTYKISKSENSTLSKSQIMPLPTWNVNFWRVFLKFELTYVTPYTSILHRDRHFVHVEHDVWNVPKIILSLKSLNKAKHRRFISLTIRAWSMPLMISFIRLKV